MTTNGVNEDGGAAEAAPSLDEDEADRLGRSLFEIMERLDPGVNPDEDGTWEGLRPRDRGLYVTAAKMFWSRLLADHDMVDGRPKARE